MGREARDSHWIPPWVADLGVPVWISGPDRTVTYINDRAEALLGVSAADCLGHPCHLVVKGTNIRGEAVCGPICQLARRVWRGHEIEPVEMRVRGHWIRVMAIKVRGPDPRGPYLVHCALGEDRAHRIEAYLERISKRTGPRAQFQPSSDHKLTRREHEILSMLAKDETLHGIAARLHVSYATVRNHVQHILNKLGVHSMAEAVAWYILTEDE